MIPVPVEQEVQTPMTIAEPSRSNVVAVGDSASLMAVIAHAARDPQTDVNKLERLMAMYERITANQAKAEFDREFSEMQPWLPTVERNGRITIRDKNEKDKGGNARVIQSTPYGLLEDINEAARPILGHHGFGISFRIGESEDKRITVTAVLSHRAGHREETTIKLMHDSTGSKNSVQAIGSSVSYGKRYTMCAILNITTKGEDDDGKGADQFITDEQVEILGKLVHDGSANLSKFLEHMGVEALHAIPAKDFNKAKNALEARLKKVKS